MHTFVLQVHLKENCCLPPDLSSIFLVSHIPLVVFSQSLPKSWLSPMAQSDISPALSDLFNARLTCLPCIQWRSPPSPFPSEWASAPDRLSAPPIAAVPLSTVPLSPSGPFSAPWFSSERPPPSDVSSVGPWAEAHTNHPAPPCSRLVDAAAGWKPGGTGQRRWRFWTGVVW